MKITEVNMNLFDAPQGYYIAVAVSKDLNMGVGLPAQIDKVFNVSDRFEKVYLGKPEIGLTYSLGNLYLLFVKDSSYDAPNKTFLLEAIRSMRDDIEDWQVTKLAIPKLCCGRFGFEWSEVKEMLESVLSDCDIEILVCCQ